MSLRSRVIAAGKTRFKQHRRVKHHQAQGRDPEKLIRSWRRWRKEHISLRKLYEASKTSGLRYRAYGEAVKLIGVRESGGNNRGPTVEKIIRYAQGQVPEPWCVDFNIWCYGHAGSKVVKPGYTRAVRYMLTPGVKQVRTPRRGDMVRFSFDHTGIYSKKLRDGNIETIEGNTGASGAVSDSTQGGDGVYRKVRHVSQVQDYLRVTR